MIGIIDYGMGNLRSVQNALDHLGEESRISEDPEFLLSCDKLVLPGVGAFGDCMENLRSKQLDDLVMRCVRIQKPLLGICVGMQMMFEESEEKGIHTGLGIFQGRIVRMKTDLPVPQIGWNLLEYAQSCPFSERLSAAPYMYYVHSYAAEDYDEKDLYAYSMYGKYKVGGVFMKDHIAAVQFHPEKSSKDGLALLSWFAKEFI